jgi:hypothetical protein
MSTSRSRYSNHKFRSSSSFDNEKLSESQNNKSDANIGEKEEIEVDSKVEINSMVNPEIVAHKEENVAKHQ